MYVSYGSHTHAVGELAVQIVHEPILTESGVPHSYREQWRMHGFLTADTQAALITAIDDLEDAYSVNGNTITLYTDSGTIARRLSAADTIGGVRIVSGPSYPDDGRGSAEFSTFRTYEITVEAIVPDRTVGLLAFTESVSFTGTGGPHFVILEPLTGAPQKQLVKQRTKQTVTQQGRAVGHFRYPTPPPPIWPEHEKEELRQMRYETPKRTGPQGQAAFTEYEIAWSYTFEAVGPLYGLPHLWKP